MLFSSKRPASSTPATYPPRVWRCSASGPRCWCCREPACAALPGPRCWIRATHTELYGNLYSNLLDYVVFAVLIFYVLTIIGIFVLRRRRPDAERPYRALGYPVLPALYIVGASVIMLVLLLYKSQITWPGLLIVLAGVPVYFLWKPRTVRT